MDFPKCKSFHVEASELLNKINPSKSHCVLPKCLKKEPMLLSLFKMIREGSLCEVTAILFLRETYGPKIRNKVQ